ncbi:formin-like protein 5 isoform X3 [Fagus crenata]
MPPRPRGRPRKKNPNDSRIHAAVEAMSPYGFPLDLVQVTVGELLNVYGGNEGWVFIEDDSYSLLLETLLEKTKGPQQEDDSSQREVGDADDRDASAAGPSIPSSSNSGTSDPVLLTNLALDSASQPNEAPNTAAPLIPTCSNLGALDAMPQSNLDLVSASQPNETPNAARESSNQLLSIY